MTSRRRLLALALAAVPLAAGAQSLTRMPRVGLLFTGSPPPESSRAVEAFRSGLRDLGYVEGRTIWLEYRWASEGKLDQLAELAAELVRANVDVLVAQASPHVAAARQATHTIPIVMGAVSDPVGAGLVASLARPGGNVTGSSLMAPAMAAKSLQLLREALPDTARVAALRQPASPAFASNWREAESAAQRLGLRLEPIDVRTPEEFERAVQTAIAGRAQAVVVIPDPLFGTNRRRLAAAALKARLPTVSFETGFADAGGLIEYGTSTTESHRRAATYVDKILKGAKPGDLPVEQPTRMELVLNLRTARALGVTLPRSLLLRADRVVE